MAFSITQHSLFDILQKLFPIIPLKSSLQILSNFKISYHNNLLEIAATDLDQSMKIISSVSGDNDSFDITANARKLFEIVRELPEGLASVFPPLKIVLSALKLKESLKAKLRVRI